jgi:hypothetical protein
VANFTSFEWAARRPQFGMFAAALALVGVVASCAAGGDSGGSVSSGITYNGPTSWTISGPEGGPFTGGSLLVILDNQSAQPVAWSASSIPSFVQLDQTSGTIDANTTVRIQCDLNLAVAQGLAHGVYRETLSFHNDSISQPDIDIDTTLVVLSQGTGSQLEPATDFFSQGAASGPFTPDGTLYTLSNTGSTVLDWAAAAPDAWVSIAPNSGSLASGSSVDIVVSINDPATASLAVGTYQSVVDWTDTSNAAVLHSRTVNLNILSGQSSSGWTSFTPSADSRIVYVSSSTGNNSWDGLAPDHAAGGSSGPKATILAGAQLLRDNMPDWLLLKRGDTFQEPIYDGQVTGYWVKRGRSATEPILVSGYGVGARPIVASGNTDGFKTWNQLYQGHYAGNLAIVGLEFFASTYTGGNEDPRGIWLLGGGANTLVEDCMVRRYRGNIVVGSDGHGGAGILTNVTIRRCVVSEAYTIVNDGGAQGLYASDAHGLLIEENVFDHNGWVDSISGSGPNWYRRNVYIQNGCTGVVFRKNIVAGTDGIQQRPGGTCNDNLFLSNALNLQFGSGNEPEPGGVSGTVSNNVILDGRDLQAGSPRGWGLIAGNVVNATFDHNIVAHNTNGHAPTPWVLNFDNGHGNPNGMQNVTFDHNIIYDWGGIGRGAQIASYQSNITLNLTFTNNDVQDAVDPTYLVALSTTTPNLLGQIHCANNRWFRASGNANQLFQIAGVDMSFPALVAAIGDNTSTFGAVTDYPDPSRTIATYHASIGGVANLAAFMAEARQQSRTNWRSQYTAEAVNVYIRAGFGL